MSGNIAKSLKIIISVLCLLFIFEKAQGAVILFPELNIYTEMNNEFQAQTSYRLFMQLDTGLKYGVKVGLGLENYNITSLSSNFVELNSIKIDSTPFDLFDFSFFFGKNRTLGAFDIGYQGFQYHQDNHLEYIGFHDITGTGFEIARGFLDDIFYPHVILYTTDKNGTNYLNIDALVKVETDKYIFEFYFGLDNSASYVFEGVTNVALSKRFGATFRTLFSNVNFYLSVFFPDAPIWEINPVDDIYFNFTQHLVSGWFEQTITFFTRPSIYNGYEERIRGDFLPDIDIYLALGARFDQFGFGVENTVLTAAPASYSTTAAPGLVEFSDRVGGYAYFLFNNIKYKLGAFYSLGPAFTPSDINNPHSVADTVGGYFHIYGSF
jgi:hypothetical protein